MDGSWMLDELRHAGAEHLDPVFVAGFDGKQGHPDVEADLEVLRQHGALGDHATVVDLGAGTGRFALASGFEITDLQVRGQLYAAYTCIRR